MRGFKELERGFPFAIVREGTVVSVTARPPSALGLESPLLHVEDALLATNRAELPPDSTATFALACAFTVSFTGEGFVWTVLVMFESTIEGLANEDC